MLQHMNVDLAGLQYLTFLASSVSDGDSFTQQKLSLLTKTAGSRGVAGFIIRTHLGEDTVTSSICLQTLAAFNLQKCLVISGHRRITDKSICFLFFWNNLQ